MADEYNSTTNWWDSSRNHFNTTGSSSSSSSGLNSTLSSFSWPPEMVDLKGPRSSIDSSSVSDSGSELHMMNLGLSSPAMDWNQALLNRAVNKHESNFSVVLQENLNSSSSFHQRGFSLDQPQFRPHGSSPDSSITCQGLKPGFQIDSTSLYGSASTILQGLPGSDEQQQQQQQQQQSMNYSYGANYNISSDELEGSWTKVPHFFRNSPPKQTHQNQLQFSNNSPFWNASAFSINDVRPNFFNSIQPQFPTSKFEEKPKICQVRDSSTIVKKSGSEKRPRNETASQVPAFKVRKEKMGDRITALQQLVSPFGKTDTASVLSEAIEYIKFLHEQVTVLSSPYMKSGAPLTHQQNFREGEEPKEDLRRRGLCLVPLTSTFTMAHETTVDIWSPTFGGYG